MPAQNINPWFLLQARIASLISASSYFTGLQPTQILTEQVADLVFRINQSILTTTGFGIVVTTAAGKARENEFEVLMTDEDLNISVIHNPTMDPGHTTLDAVFAAVQAVQNQTCQVTAPPVIRPFDKFRITGHERRNDGPEGFDVHEIHVLAGLRLS